MTATREETENRLVRAVLTLDSIPDPDGRFRYGARAKWSETVRAFWESYNGTAAQEYLIRNAGRFSPSPADYDDMLVALGWIVPPWHTQYGLLKLRAYGFSWDAVAARKGRSREYWRKKFDRFLTAAHGEAAKARAQALHRGPRARAVAQTSGRI